MAQTTWLVSTTGNDNNSGNSWGTSFRTVRKALQVAASGQSVWVDKGTCYPDEGSGAVNNDRALSFDIPVNNLRFLGGFAGTETSPAQRNTAGKVMGVRWSEVMESMGVNSKDFMDTRL